MLTCTRVNMAYVSQLMIYIMLDKHMESRILDPKFTSYFATLRVEICQPLLQTELSYGRLAAQKYVLMKSSGHMLDCILRTVRWQIKLSVCGSNTSYSKDASGLGAKKRVQIFISLKTSGWYESPNNAAGLCRTVRNKLKKKQTIMLLKNGHVFASLISGKK